MSNTFVLGHDDRTAPSYTSDGLRVWNGALSTIAAVAATGNAQIDGLLSGSRWAGAISYSAPDALADYQAGYFTGAGMNTTDFSAFNAQQMVAFHYALDANTFTQPLAAKGFSVEGFTGLNINFIGGGSGGGTIRGANMDDANPTAYAFYPSNGVYGGDTFFGDNYDATANSYKTPTAGNYAWHTFIHEIGHSLGLKHGHETGGPGNTALPAAVDSIEFSVMTYRGYIGQVGYFYGQWDAPQTFMTLDIQALQKMYGADFTVNSGNTIYKWNPANGDTRVNGAIAIDAGGVKIFATIWDGGGTDTYDLSSYTTNLKLNLAPGGFSVFSAAQLADLGGGPNGGFARGNIWNAKQFGVDVRSLIENAIGGSGNDSILGNNANNRLTGNSGNDVLSGNGGTDTLLGGIGNDTLNGGLGKDIMTGNANNDTFLFSAKTHSVVGINADVITDFGDSGIDKIGLAALSPLLLIYRHNLAFTGINQVRINDVAGADVIVEVNLSGTLAADFSIRLTGTTLASLSAADFIL